MPEKVENCLLCEHETHSHFETIEFRDEQVVNQICDQCGLVFQSPRMTATELDEFYAAEYRQVYQGDEGPNEKDLRTQEGRAESLLKFVMDTVPAVNRHLDVGCSAGILLQEFQGHYCSQLVGVEPGEAYRTYT